MVSINQSFIYSFIQSTNQSSSHRSGLFLVSSLLMN